MIEDIIIAKNIVNQLFDLAEVPVEKRQEINDRCDEFVVSIIEPYTLDAAKWKAFIRTYNKKS
jgi:hypothetical protein